MSSDPRRPSIVATASPAKSIDQRSDKYKSRKKWWIVLGVVIGVSVTIMVTSLSICYSDHRSIEICWDKFYKFLKFPTKTEEIITECSTNDDCSGASDTCNANICYCGSEEKCTETTDTCTAGQCKCGLYGECPSTESCYQGTCACRDDPSGEATSPYTRMTVRCTFKKFCQYSWFSASCPRTCGLCDGGCFDKEGDTTCNSFKNNGYCSNEFEDLMRVHCKKSCGFCEG